jgi:hypothetical protein
MRKVLVRWRHIVACAVVLSVVVTADARDGAPVRKADTDARQRLAATERDPGERVLSRIIRRIVKSLTDELSLPRP